MNSVENTPLRHKVGYRNDGSIFCQLRETQRCVRVLHYKTIFGLKDCVIRDSERDSMNTQEWNNIEQMQ